MTPGPFLWALLAAALFGAATPASKALLDDVGPFTLAGLLYLGAAIAVLPTLRALPRRVLDDRPTLRRLAGAVVLGGIVGPALLMIGLAHASASAVSIWLSLETVFTALLARAFFREHVSARTVLALLMIVGAVALLASPSPAALTPAALLVAGACLAWGADNNLMSLVDGVSPAQSTFVKGLVAGATNLGIGLAVEGAPSASPSTLGLGLVVGALGYGASLVLYVAASQQLGATRSQLVFSTAPFWGLGISWAALGDPITPVAIAAGALVALALAMLPRDRHAHRHVHVPIAHAHWHRHDDGHHHHAHERPPRLGWHYHAHQHDAEEHEHPHEPDLHHRHGH
jgi:drug/metabolite transporter (DMT)-like permease